MLKTSFFKLRSDNVPPTAQVPLWPWRKHKQGHKIYTLGQIARLCCRQLLSKGNGSRHNPNLCRHGNPPTPTRACARAGLEKKTSPAQPTEGNFSRQHGNSVGGWSWGGLGGRSLQSVGCSPMGFLLTCFPFLSPPSFLFRHAAGIGRLPLPPAVRLDGVRTGGRRARRPPINDWRAGRGKVQQSEALF